MLTSVAGNAKEVLDCRESCARPGLWLRAFQRYGSILQFTPHFHSWIPDGVFSQGTDGTLQFHRLPPPNDDDIDRLQTNICRCGTYWRIRKAIHRAADLIGQEDDR